MNMLDAVIVGAGFAGLYMLHKCRSLGLTCKVIEAAPDVGGTWYWNRYPGARCDVESFSYSYSFSESIEQEWRWSNRYAFQPEILAYARFVADKLGLRRHIAFNTRVITGTYDEDQALWHIATNKGEQIPARYLIMATGCLSVPKVPDVPELERFKGDVLHTAHWPEGGYDFAGKRVGVIGTGSSGVQCIPLIAEQAAHLTIFQRTPNFSIPAWNGPISDEQQTETKAHYRELRRKARNSYAGDYADEYYLSIMKLTPEAREKAFEARWQEGGFNFQYAFSDLMDNEEANELAADFVRRKIRAIVNDPATAEKLCPKDHPIGSQAAVRRHELLRDLQPAKRSLVDLRDEPITGFTADSHQNGAPSVFTRHARAGHRLRCHDGRTDCCRHSWARREEPERDAGARDLPPISGLQLRAFPTCLSSPDPAAPPFLANVLLAIEQHVEWLSDLLAYARAHGIHEIEADRCSTGRWMKEVTASADRTLYPRANSWYRRRQRAGQATRLHALCRWLQHL